MTDVLYCSFCGKNSNEVEQLIAGPSVFICDGCSDMTHEIVLEKRGQLDPEKIKHREIKLEQIGRLRNDVKLLLQYAERMESLLADPPYWMIEEVEQLPLGTDKP